MTLGRHQARGPGGTQRTYSVENVTISMAGLSLQRNSLGATDLSVFARQGGRPMQLVLGYELFQGCVVRFDYAAGVMDVWDAEHAPRRPPGEAVPMTLVENHPYLEGVLDLPGRPPLRGRFVIDTGSSMALMVASEITERESVATAFPRTLTMIAREPRARFEVPSRLTCPAPRSRAAPGGVEVRWVNDGTPAAAAGLRIGDLVTHIDGEPAEGIDPAALRLGLQQEGRVVRLKVKRHDESSSSR